MIGYRPDSPDIALTLPDTSPDSQKWGPDSPDTKAHDDGDF